MCPSIAVIIVTHNSQNVIDSCVDSLLKQTKCVDQIIIVDSGSSETHYLGKYSSVGQIQIFKEDNIGFSGSNNVGYSKISDKTGFVVFANPDTILTDSFTEDMISVFKDEPTVGILTGKLLHFDMEQNLPSGKIDSTGIFRKWFGRWYDRGQGEIDRGQYDSAEYVPAICGALMCCRNDLLKQFGGKVFNPDFFMYKEDVELSLKSIKKGFKLLYNPSLVAYHGRGWQKDRTSMPLFLREMSARNEVKLYLSHPSPYILWALFKYLLVKIFRV